jgi:enamine deaminase RidA (YjgF/YER057c/UK114 family)
LPEWPFDRRTAIGAFGAGSVVFALDPLAATGIVPRMSKIEEALAALNLKLPKAAAPVADYVPTVESGGLLFLSGQLPFKDGEVMRGRLGEDTDIAVGKTAAQACGLMIVAQLKAALGDLDRVERIVRLGVFVSSDPRFTEQPKVADGASSLMVALFGDKGRHARSAVGVPVLPMGAMVEIDAVVAIRPA